MPNHFHLLLTQIEKNGISKFMQKLATGYSMYYNKRYERTGTLFEGKFKSEHANEDDYLKHLFSYIHLNPVKIINPSWKEKGVKNKPQILSYLEKYPYSSYPDYLGHDRPQNKIINPETFPEYFPDRKSVKEEIFTWLDLNKQARPV